MTALETSGPFVVVDSYEDLDSDGADDAAFTAPFDLDGDGYDESIAGDLDLDGYIDSVFMDLDADGAVDTTVLDLDADGVAETVWFDLDGDAAHDIEVTFVTDELAVDDGDSCTASSWDDLV